ncbi:MAG TPA: RcnB family protein [Rhizomicrobium sp.]|jgi:Ni/Co efflux regulator RcnB
MKKLLISTLVLGLAAAAPAIAYAQDDHGDKDKHPAMAGQGDENNGPKADDKKVDDHKTKTDDHANSMSGSEHNTPPDTDKNKKKTDKSFSDQMRGGDNNNRDNNRDRDTTKHDDHNTNSRSSHTTNVNINISTYRRTVTSSRHFRVGVYHAPRGYSYRRYNIGERLPVDYYARDFWLSDYASYDLVAPPDGYVWVRFGPDALLIDEDSGEVLQVVYGVFI